MAFTTTLTVTNGSRALVVTQSGGTYAVTVGESPAVAGYPTTDFLVAKPSGGTQRRVLSGSTYTFASPDRIPFPAGTILGDLQTVAGTTTFFVDES